MAVEIYLIVSFPIQGPSSNLGEFLGGALFDLSSRLM